MTSTSPPAEAQVRVTSRLVLEALAEALNAPIEAVENLHLDERLDKLGLDTSSTLRLIDALTSRVGRPIAPKNTPVARLEGRRPQAWPERRRVGLADIAGSPETSSCAYAGDALLPGHG